jgi:hypothetical protein
MGTPLRACQSPRSGAGLRLHRGNPNRVDSPGVCWRINGHRARLLVWTVDEWERLAIRPLDAQYHPSGVWCALRLDGS